MAQIRVQLILFQVLLAAAPQQTLPAEGNNE